MAYFTWIAALSPIANETKIQALSLVGLFIDPNSLISARLLIALKLIMTAMLALWLVQRANRFVYVLAPLVFILPSVVETHYFVRHQTGSDFLRDLVACKTRGVFAVDTDLMPHNGATQLGT